MKREAREDRAYSDWAYDLLDDAVPAFHKQRFEVWLKGLLAAAIGGAAGGVQGLQMMLRSRPKARS